MDPADYIAASDGTGEAVRAIVTTDRLVGAVTLIVDSVVRWPNKFVATSGTLDPLTGLLDDVTLTVFKGTLTGSIITIEEFAPGYSDIGHTVGQVVVLKPSTLWADMVRAYLDDLTAFTEASTHVALVTNEVVNGTKNGVNTVFTIDGDAVTGTVELYKNGVRQNPGAGNDYTVSGSTITMAVAPATGAVLLADYYTSTSQFTNPSITGLRMNEVPTGTVNSSNKDFTTLSSYVPGTLEVWVNGLKQLPTTHYTETTPSSGTFAFGDAPRTGDNILVNYHNTLSAGIGDADTLDTYHASPTPSTNSILPLDANAKFPFAGMPSGSTIQFVYTQYTEITTAANKLIPLDDTIPQITEGMEVATQAITPKAADSILIIDFNCWAYSSTANWITVAIFQDAIGNALAANTQYMTTATAGLLTPIKFCVVAGSTTARTYRIRLGTNGNATLTANGNNASRWFGAIPKSCISVTEVKA